MMAKIVSFVFSLLSYFFKKPTIATDVVVEKNGKILLIKRTFWPYDNYYSLPGGMVEYGEKVEDAAKRELYEETGLKAKELKLLGVFSDPKRDPRWHAITIAFAVTKFSGKIRPSIESKEVIWMDIKKVKKLKLAFDHNKIINAYLRWKYGQSKEKNKV